MRLSIRGPETRLTSRLRMDIERRVYLYLSRFGSRIRRVEVRLAEVAGPGGRLDCACTVEVAARGFPPVTAEQLDTRMSVAVDHAVARVARQLARTVAMIEGPFAGPRPSRHDSKPRR